MGFASASDRRTMGYNGRKKGDPRKVRLPNSFIATETGFEQWEVRRLSKSERFFFLTRVLLLHLWHIPGRSVHSARAFNLAGSPSAPRPEWETGTAPRDPLGTAKSGPDLNPKRLNPFCLLGAPRIRVPKKRVNRHWRTQSLWVTGRTKGFLGGPGRQECPWRGPCACHGSKATPHGEGSLHPGMKSADRCRSAPQAKPSFPQKGWFG